MGLILASKSPRRKEILSMVTADFTVRVSGAEEIVPDGTDVFDVPAILAKTKAEAIGAEPNDIIIGCDTVVILNDKILGKPRDKAEAIKMLQELSGTEHYVVSGLAIIGKGKTYITSETTLVKMRPLLDREIVSYVEKFSPTDKAGAYGIQEMAGAFVEKIDGDFYNVVGLPLCTLVKALRDEFGMELI